MYLIDQSDAYYIILINYSLNASLKINMINRKLLMNMSIKRKLNIKNKL